MRLKLQEKGSPLILILAGVNSGRLAVYFRRSSWILLNPNVVEKLLFLAYRIGMDYNVNAVASGSATCNNIEPRR